MDNYFIRLIRGAPVVPENDKTPGRRLCRPELWELALLIALCFALAVGIWARGEQSALADKLIRLHVIAESDERGAQSAKLLVRDRVLELLEPELAGVRNADEARELIERKLPELEAAASQTIAPLYPETSVKAELSREVYPTRLYEGFSLPAGEYSSLRITLGEGAGQNWWCVVFPPLCAQASAGPADIAEQTGGMLSDGDVALISGESEGYVVKFRILELWGELCSMLS